jgi:hypothetical protein
MGNNFSSKYELFRNVKADDKKGLNKNYGIFLVLRRKTGFCQAHLGYFKWFLVWLEKSVDFAYNSCINRKEGHSV